MPQANASSASLPPPSHGSGSGWFATPFLYDSFIHYFTPVYPDAIQAECLPHGGSPPDWVRFVIFCGGGSRLAGYVGVCFVHGGFDGANAPLPFVRIAGRVRGRGYDRAQVVERAGRIYLIRISDRHRRRKREIRSALGRRAKAARFARPLSGPRRPAQAECLPH